MHITVDLDIIDHGCLLLLVNTEPPSRNRTQDNRRSDTALLHFCTFALMHLCAYAVMLSPDNWTLPHISAWLQASLLPVVITAAVSECRDHWRNLVLNLNFVQIPNLVAGGGGLGPVKRFVAFSTPTAAAAWTLISRVGIIIIIIMEAAHRNSVPNSFSSCPCIFVNFNLFAAVVNLPPFQPTINSPRLPTANSNIKALYYQLHWIFSAKMRNIYIRHYPGREQSKHWSPPDAVKD